MYILQLVNLHALGGWLIIILSGELTEPSMHFYFPQDLSRWDSASLLLLPESSCVVMIVPDELCNV